MDAQLRPATPVTPAPARLEALDAFRGAIMLMMASAGFELTRIAEKFPDSGLLHFIGWHTEHAEWVGCTLWDLIQPAFMFMVGVALPWSVANRLARGESRGKLFVHALWRAVILVLLSIFLQSNSSPRTDWSFNNVLAQIGLAYPWLFLVSLLRPRFQAAIAFGILFVYWLAFALYPLPTADFDWKSVGVPAEWPHLSGFAAHWEKNTNLAAMFDRWLINFFPRDKPFLFSSGGYTTLNFIPSIATMIFGLLAGNLLRGERGIVEKLKLMLVAGMSGIVIGWALDATGVCPMVKRIWTPSFAIFSGGWVVLLLAGFVAIIEWRGWKSWAFPLKVVGLNPIAMYCMWQIMAGFIRESFWRHLGPLMLFFKGLVARIGGNDMFERLGDAGLRGLNRVIVLLIMWLIVFWMYRRKIFLRI